MPTTDTPAEQPDAAHVDPRIARPTGSSHPQPSSTDVAGTRLGAAFAVAAAVAVGALVSAVIPGPSDASVETSIDDRVELNRTTTLRYLATPTPYDRVEQNRTTTLRDLTTPTPYDRVEQNRTTTLRDLTTPIPSQEPGDDVLRTFRPDMRLDVRACSSGGLLVHDLDIVGRRPAMWWAAAHDRR